MRRGVNAFLVILSACLVFRASAAVYYLDQRDGDDANDGLALDRAFKTAKASVKSLAPGDELRIVGQLANPSYDPTYRFGDVSDAHLWHGENTLTVSDVHGTADGWITITSHNTSSVLKGDGANIVRVQKSSYIRLRNLHVQGEVDNIPLSTAKAVQFVYKDAKAAIKYRVDPSLTPDQINKLKLDILGPNIARVSYTDTRGVYVSDSHHVELSGSHVHHMPGGGIRFASSEYQTIFDSEVDNCARKSYSGTHALVVTYATDKMPREAPEGTEDYRAIVARNMVHHNYNEIFSWVGTKPFIHAKIDEGKGISLQRNQEFKNGGRILVANNVVYWNGYSGVHSQDGDNVDVFSNTAYMNSYTNTKGEYKDDGDARSGNNIGISIQGGKNCRIVNNIAYIDTSWKGMPISTSGLKEDKVGKNNLVFGEGTQPIKMDADFDAFATATIEADPKFSSTATFRLTAGSPAVGAAAAAWSPCEDFYGNKRSRTEPSIGAVEANCEDGECEDKTFKDVELSISPTCYALRVDEDDMEEGQLDDESVSNEAEEKVKAKKAKTKAEREQAKADRKKKAEERRQKRQEAKDAKAKNKSGKAHEKGNTKSKSSSRLQKKSENENHMSYEGLLKASLGARNEGSDTSSGLALGLGFVVLCIFIAFNGVFAASRSREQARFTSQCPLLDAQSADNLFTQNYGAGV